MTKHAYRSGMKRSLSLFITLAMVLALLPVFTVGARAEDWTNPVTESAWITGEGEGPKLTASWTGADNCGALCYLWADGSTYDIYIGGTGESVTLRLALGESKDIVPTVAERPSHGQNIIKSVSGDTVTLDLSKTTTNDNASQLQIDYEDNGAKTKFVRIQKVAATTIKVNNLTSSGTVAVYAFDTAESAGETAVGDDYIRNPGDQKTSVANMAKYNRVLLRPNPNFYVKSVMMNGEEICGTDDLKTGTSGINGMKYLVYGPADVGEGAYTGYNYIEVEFAELAADTTPVYTESELRTELAKNDNKTILVVGNITSTAAITVPATMTLDVTGTNTLTISHDDGIEVNGTLKVDALANCPTGKYVFNPTGKLMQGSTPVVGEGGTVKLTTAALTMTDNSGGIHYSIAKTNDTGAVEFNGLTVGSGDKLTIDTGVEITADDGDLTVRGELVITDDPAVAAEGSVITFIGENVEGTLGGVEVIGADGYITLGINAKLTMTAITGVGINYTVDKVQQRGSDPAAVATLNDSFAICDIDKLTINDATLLLDDGVPLRIDAGSTTTISATGVIELGTGAVIDIASGATFSGTGTIDLGGNVKATAITGAGASSTGSIVFTNDGTPAALTTITVTVNAAGTITAAATDGGTLYYAVEDTDPTEAIAQWNTTTTVSDADSALTASFGTTPPTLEAAHNGKFLVVIEAASADGSAKLKAAGKSAAIAINKYTAVASADANNKTNKITLTFDVAVPGLTANDITLTANGTGATKGELTMTGTEGNENKIYELAITGVTSSGNVALSINKAGVAPVNEIVAVAFGDVPVSTATIDKATAKVGDTLTATANSGASGTLTYQWYRADTSSTALDTPVPGEAIVLNGTSVSYTVVDADAGKHIYVVITTDAGEGTSAKSASIAIAQQQVTVTVVTTAQPTFFTGTPTAVVRYSLESAEAAKNGVTYPVGGVKVDVGKTIYFYITKTDSGQSGNTAVAAKEYTAISGDVVAGKVLTVAAGDYADIVTAPAATVSGTPGKAGTAISTLTTPMTNAKLYTVPPASVATTDVAYELYVWDDLTSVKLNVGVPAVSYKKAAKGATEWEAQKRLTAASGVITFPALANRDVLLIYTDADNYVKIRVVQVAKVNVKVSGTSNSNTVNVASTLLLSGEPITLDLGTPANVTTLNGYVFDIENSIGTHDGDTLEFTVTHPSEVELAAKKDGTEFTASSTTGTTTITKTFVIELAAAKVYDITFTFTKTVNNAADLGTALVGNENVTVGSSMELDLNDQTSSTNTTESVIDVSGAGKTLTISDTAGAASGNTLTLGGDVNVGDSATVKVDTGAKVEVAKEVAVGAGGTMTVDNAATVTVNNGATLKADGASAAVAVNNGAKVEVAAGAKVEVTDSAEMTVNGDDSAVNVAGEGAKVSVGASSNLNLGSDAKVEVKDGAALDIKGTGAAVTLDTGAKLTVDSGAAVTLDGSSAALNVTNGTLELKAETAKINVDQGTLTVGASGKLDVASGTVAVAATGKLDIQGTAKVAGGNVDVAGTLEIAANKTLEIEGSGTVLNFTATKEAEPTINLNSSGKIKLAGSKIRFGKPVPQVMMIAGLSSPIVDSYIDISGQVEGVLGALTSDSTGTIEIGAGMAVELTASYTVPENMTLIIEAGAVVIVPDGVTLRGNITNNGRIVDVDGNVIANTGTNPDSIYVGAGTSGTVVYIADEEVTGVGRMREITLQHDSAEYAVAWIEHANGTSSMQMAEVGNISSATVWKISYDEPADSVTVWLISSSDFPNLLVSLPADTDYEATNTTP